jgi:MFS family permease
MSSGAWMMGIVIAITLGTLIILMFATVRTIRNERTPGRSVWREFGLGLLLMILFFATWISHAIAEWQVFSDEQLSQGQSPKMGNFVAEFAQSTFENWQSEFLQLFSFVVLAALYIHKGSAESKDGEENIEASLRRIESHLGTLPSSAPTEPGKEWRLPETPLEVGDSE